MNKSALIGYTGFIGQNLTKQNSFDYFYNSKNIKDIHNREFDLIISCGNSSTRWQVNKEPQKDYDNIMSFIDTIKKVKARKFILLSTIDVYSCADNVNEDTQINNNNQNFYGKHRYELEKAIESIFPTHLIIRLPIVYGQGFKKNIIFDALNKHELHKINPKSLIQIYNVRNMYKDIVKFNSTNYKKINLATEPLQVDRVFKDIFKIELDTKTVTPTIYDMRTNRYDLTNNMNYFYNTMDILHELQEFKKEYEAKRI